MRLLILSLVLSTPAILGVDITAQPASEERRRGTVSVSDFASSDSSTAGIQEAIDALEENGGIVTIPPGEYLLRRSIRVRSYVTLQGAGEKTVLRKVAQVGSKLAAPSDAESRSVRVQDATGFREGDEIGIFDQTTVGWLHAHAIVKGVQGDELLLDRRLGRAFDPAEGASVINYFPAITGIGLLSNVVLKDLTIDGQSEENPGPSIVTARAPGKPTDLGFTFAAINLVDATDSRIEGCRIKGWPSDGISVQRGKRNVVTNCVVENCRGPGFHVGGRETDSEFSENEARGNLGDGFYFCAWVTRVVVKNSKFIGNQGNGVGGLGDSEDKDNIVEDNLCDSNGRSGIFLWNGESNTVRNNSCANNSQSSPGRWSGILLAKTERSVVSGNRCFDNQQAKTQKHGIEELPNCRANSITDNDCRGNAQSGLALAGKNSQKDGNLE